MKRLRDRYVLAMILLIGAAGPACDGVIVTISFVDPTERASIETQTAAMPAGTGLVVKNDLGSTRVEVDPNATMASIHITKVAFAGSEALATQLLAEMDVQIQPADATSNDLRVTFKLPAGATGDTSEFEFNFDDDEFHITGVSSGRKVAIVRLVIKIPPGHGVEVMQGKGPVRGIGLDTFISLRTEIGSIHLSQANTGATLSTGRGNLKAEDHRGTLEMLTPRGDLTIDLDSLAAGQIVSGRTGNGTILLGMPHNINAELTARTERGAIRFDTFGFDNASADFSSKTLTATINAGGPPITLSTGEGDVNIDGQN